SSIAAGGDIDLARNLIRVADHDKVLPRFPEAEHFGTGLNLAPIQQGLVAGKVLRRCWKCHVEEFHSAESYLSLLDRAKALAPHETLRACFENGWRGRPARPGRRPADRKGHEHGREKGGLIGSTCRSLSVLRVAGRPGPVPPG